MKRLKYLILLGFLLITALVFANPFNTSMRMDMGGSVSESESETRFVDSAGNYFVDSAGNYAIQSNDGINYDNAEAAGIGINSLIFVEELGRFIGVGASQAAVVP